MIEYRITHPDIVVEPGYASAAELVIRGNAPIVHKAIRALLEHGFNVESREDPPWKPVT